MLNRLRKILLDDTFPYVELGVEYYAKVLGTLRRHLQLNTFTAQETQQVILAIIDPKQKK